MKNVDKSVMMIFFGTFAHYFIMPFKIYETVMKSEKLKIWAEFSPCEYYDAILKRDDDSAAIAYYLIDKQLRNRLRTTFRNVGAAEYWEFQDTIEDYFLYLHDGSSWVYNKPFYMLESIENKDSLFKWIAITYKNFILRKLDGEVKRKIADETEILTESEVQDEEKIKNLSTAIAYADQQCVSRSRFVMYRLLLTFLNKSLAVPQEEMAKAVDMQPVTYRVSTKRVKDSILDYIRCLEQGRKLELDVEHRQMYNTIVANFDNLYPTLSMYYNKAISQLPTAEAINNLRFGYRYNENFMCHEDVTSYGLCNCQDTIYLYDKIMMFLDD